MKYSSLKIQNQNIENLQPYQGNARTHSNCQIHKIAESIKEFGFSNPILVDSRNTIIAGHGRLEAAKILGISSVPTICLSHLSDAQKRAYIIADNKLAEMAGWDKDILSIELQHLLELDTDFDISITGFEMPEIDLMLSSPTAPETHNEEVYERAQETIIKSGELWILGNHKIYCGNSLEKASYQNLLGTEKAEMIFTDPPYNVKVDGHICGNGKVKHQEFAMASGEMTESEFTHFLKQSFTHMITHSKNGSIHFVCMDWRHMKEILTAGESTYNELKNLCVWNKNNGGMGSLYRSKHELIFVFKNGASPHINHVELGKHGRYRTNVWDYAGANTVSRTSENVLALHPTVKPTAMVADAMLDCSNRNSIILDPFGGSGTTLLAAEKVGRQARLIEYDPLYVDVTIRRWQELTGKLATRSDGAAFSDYLAQGDNHDIQ